MHYIISCMLFTQFHLKQSLTAYFAIATKDVLFWLSIVTSPQLIRDVTQTQSTGIMMSYMLIVLARTNWSKAIFTNE